MKKALFEFTISPVKSFVENGRKMRDLYAGSSILSGLIANAITYLENQKKDGELEVVFPPPEQWKQSKESNVPNRLVVDISNYGGNEKMYQDLAQNLTKCVEKKFREVCELSFKSVMKAAGGADFKFADEQLDLFLEIHWLFQPYKTDENNETDKGEYTKAYKEMIANTNAIKGIRPFDQTKEPWGRKCLLHPEYNGIFVKDVEGESFPSNTNNEHIIKLPNAGKFKFNIKNSEALSAIAFVKRMYGGENSRFISPRDRVLENTLALKTGKDDLFYKKIEKNKIFEERKMINLGINMTHLTDAIYDVWDGDIKYDPELEYPKEILYEAQNLRNELKSDDPALKNFKLQQYYAIIKFDGDSMGIKYSKKKDKDAHSKLSAEICHFAKDARKLIEDAGGICIYAGGEDVSAMLTLQNLWDTLQKLHVRFAEIDEEDSFTFSAGIVIAHLRSPLKDVMRRVGEAQKTAKKGDKNSFAISLMKRGSKIRTVKYTFGNGYAQLKAIAELIDLFNKDENSRSFVYNLSHLLLKLTMHSEKETNREMINSLVKQAISHQGIKEEVKVMKHIRTLYDTVDTKTLMNTLDIVGFLSGKMIRSIEEEGQDDVVQNQSS